MTEDNEILDTTVRLFQQYGIKSVSMDDICRELGISKKTIYTHYAQKDDLVAAALHRVEEHIAKVVNSEEFARKDVWDIILHWAEQTQKTPDSRKIPALAYDLNKYYPTLAREHNNKVEELNQQALRTLFLKGQSEGIFRSDMDIEMCTYLFTKMNGHAIEESVKQDGKYPFIRMLDFTIDLMLRGILSSEGLVKYENMIKKNKKE